VKRSAASNLSFFEPMKALRVRDLSAGDWIYKMKFDGYRALAFKNGKEVRLLSRNQTLFNDNYLVLIDALKSLKAKSFIIKTFCRFLPCLPDESFFWQDRPQPINP